MAAPRFLEPELQKQGVWVGLIREGFLEEGNQDPGDGDGHGDRGSGAGGSLCRYAHPAAACLRASLSMRGLGEDRLGYDLLPGFGASERAGIGREGWAPGLVLKIAAPF